MSGNKSIHVFAIIFNTPRHEETIEFSIPTSNNSLPILLDQQQRSVEISRPKQSFSGLLIHDTPRICAGSWRGSPLYRPFTTRYVAARAVEKNTVFTRYAPFPLLPYIRVVVSVSTSTLSCKYIVVNCGYRSWFHGKSSCNVQKD